ncbi:MAG: helix-turn-helix domain-containing protein [Marinicaulis sp.]|nr:helix-turn-helix domain-containing protein [Marinicaulis sp.]
MRESEKEIVRSLPLFSGMAPDHFEIMLKGSFLQKFPATVVLFSEQDHTDFLHVLVDGQVELFANANNREGTMTLIKPVATFVLASALADGAYQLSARTLQTSQILMIPAENVREVMALDSDFAQKTIVELAECYHGVVRAYKNIKLRTAVERLANYLLVQNRRQGDNDGLVLPVEKRTLASMLGMTPENLSRAFNTLKPYGVVIDGAEISLNNLSDLETLAKPSAHIDAN